jgi:hypothetical protein
LAEGDRVRFCVAQPAHNYMMYVCVYPQVGIQTTLTYPLDDGSEIPLYVSQQHFITHGWIVVVVLYTSFMYCYILSNVMFYLSINGAFFLPLWFLHSLISVYLLSLKTLMFNVACRLKKGGISIENCDIFL